MMKILLISPNILPLPKGYVFQRFIIEDFFPLGLAYIASFIKKHGYEVRILNAYSERFKNKDIYNLIREYKPKVIGIANPMHYELGSQIITMAKRIFPQIITVLGGITPTFMPFEIMENIPLLDFIIRGEGEIPFLYLLQTLEGKREITSIKGLVYRKPNGVVAVNEGTYCAQDIDIFPFPAKDIFITRNKQTHFRYKRLFSMVVSRGCNYNCKFCVIKDIFGKGIRYRSIKLVADEMEESVDKFGVKLIRFRDSTFTVDFNYVNMFIDEIMRRGIHKKVSFSIATRVDCVNASILRKLKQANCSRIFYGVESHTQSTLDTYNKRVSIQQIIDSFILTREIGIKTTALAFFDPYRVIEKGSISVMISELVRFLKLLKPNILCFSPLVICPNSPMYSEILNEGAIDKEGYKYLFDREYIPSKRLSKKEVENTILKVYSAVFLNKRLKSTALKLIKYLYRFD